MNGKACVHKKKQEREIRFGPAHPATQPLSPSLAAHQSSSSPPPPCPTSPASPAPPDPPASMLHPVHRLPVAPSRPAVHPHISAAPPSLRLRRVARTTPTTPVVCCSGFAGSLPVANHGGEFEPRSRSLCGGRGSTVARVTPVSMDPGFLASKNGYDSNLTACSTLLEFIM
jgi:hypothetical protein